MLKRWTFFIIIPVLAGLCGADTIIVNWDGSGDYTTIQAAINDANELDTIVVAEGTYEENVNFNGKSVTVRSVEPRDWDVVQNTIIDGNYAGSCVVFENGETNEAVLEGFGPDSRLALTLRTCGRWSGSRIPRIRFFFVRVRAATAGTICGCSEPPSSSSLTPSWPGRGAPRTRSTSEPG